MPLVLVIDTPQKSTGLFYILLEFESSSSWPFNYRLQTTEWTHCPNENKSEI